jgi:N-acetylglucosaminyldiphosphoundecaprenol N-acetyl-beta-D-mannosaminyltransferase
MKNTVEPKNNQKIREVGSIFGLNFVSTQIDPLILYLLASIQTGHKLSVVTPNPEILVAATVDPDLHTALSSADVRIPDGVGIRLFLPVTIIKGRELFVRLLEVANTHKLKVYFIGSSSETIARLVKKVTEQYPSIVFKADTGGKLNKSAEPITPLDRKTHDAAIAQIRKMRPHIVFVAYGAPKQEKWIQAHRNLPVSLFMSVGGSFDSFVDTKKVPPRLFTFLSLEWAWRLFYEPSRLPRILTAVFVFPFLVIKERILKRK